MPASNKKTAQTKSRSGKWRRKDSPTSTPSTSPASDKSASPVAIPSAPKPIEMLTADSALAQSSTANFNESFERMLSAVTEDLPKQFFNKQMMLYFKNQQDKSLAAFKNILSSSTHETITAASLSTTIKSSAGSHHEFEVIQGSAKIPAILLDEDTAVAMLLTLVSQLAQPSPDEIPTIFLAGNTDTNALATILNAAKTVGVKIVIKQEKLAEKVKDATKAHNHNLEEAYKRAELKESVTISKNDELTRDRVTKPAYTTGINNNCFFHCVAHTLFTKPKGTIYKILAKDISVYLQFVRAFNEHLNVNYSGTEILAIIEKISNPVDRELVLGPVLRRLYQQLFLSDNLETSELVHMQQAQAFMAKLQGKLHAYSVLSSPITTQGAYEHNLAEAQSANMDMELLEDDSIGDMLVMSSKNPKPLWQLSLVHASKHEHWNFTYPSLDQNEAHNDEVELSMNVQQARRPQSLDNTLYQLLYDTNRDHQECDISALPGPENARKRTHILQTYLANIHSDTPTTLTRKSFTTLYDMKKSRKYKDKPAELLETEAGVLSTSPAL